MDADGDFLEEKVKYKRKLFFDTFYQEGKRGRIKRNLCVTLEGTDGRSVGFCSSGKCCGFSILIRRWRILSYMETLLAEKQKLYIGRTKEAASGTNIL